MSYFCSCYIEAMDRSPPLGPKPRSAIPSHLVNGGSQLHRSASVRDANERDNLNSSIRSSFTSRKPIELNSSRSTMGTGEGSAASERAVAR